MLVESQGVKTEEAELKQCRVTVVGMKNLTMADLFEVGMVKNLETYVVLRL